MKTLGKILLVLCLLLAVAITFTIGWRPFIGPRARATTNRQFERTPERLARGRYLVVGLAGCESLPLAEGLEDARSSQPAGHGTRGADTPAARSAGDDRSLEPHARSGNGRCQLER